MSRYPGDTPEGECPAVKLTGGHDFMTIVVVPEDDGPHRHELGCYLCSFRLEDPWVDEIWPWTKILAPHLEHLFSMMPKPPRTTAPQREYFARRVLNFLMREHGWRPPE